MSRTSWKSPKFGVDFSSLNASSQKAVVVQQCLTRNECNRPSNVPNWYILVWHFPIQECRSTTSMKAIESIDTIKENSLKELKTTHQSVYQKCTEDYVLASIFVLGSMGPTLKSTKYIWWKKLIFCVFFNSCKYLLHKIYKKLVK